VGIAEAAAPLALTDTVISLPNVTINRSNTAIGVNALLKNTTGFSNTASGVSALQSNTTGRSNTASGVSALANNLGGGSNTADGVSALQSNTAGFSNTASGVNALFRNTSGNNNTADGVRALQNNVTGGSNTALGVNALFNNTTGANNTALGAGADVFPGDLQNATAIGAGALVNASNKIRLGNAAVTIIEAPVGITIVSDCAQKENFQTIDGNTVLEKMRGLNLGSWNIKGHDPERFRHYGPIAQEFYAAFGQDNVGTIGSPTTINSTDLSGILMIALQALEKKNTQQKEEIQHLKADNAELKVRLDRLDQIVR
jgi:hypothetical protein